MEHRFPWQGWYIGGMLLDDHRRETTWHYQAAGWRREANRPRLKPGCMTSGGCTYDAWAGLGPLDQGHRAGHRLTEFMTDLSWPPFSLTFGLHIIAIWPAEKHTTACLHEFNFDVYQALKAWWEEANDVYACQETGNTRVSPCVSRMAGFVVPLLCLLELYIYLTLSWAINYWFWWYMQFVSGWHYLIACNWPPHTQTGCRWLELLGTTLEQPASDNLRTNGVNQQSC